MVLLDYLLWLQLLLLFSAGVFYFSGRWTSEGEPNETYRVFKIFWRVFLVRSVSEVEVPDVARQWRKVQLAVQNLDSGAETSDDDALLLSGWTSEPYEDDPAMETAPALTAKIGDDVRTATIGYDVMTLTINVAAQPGPPRLLGCRGEELNVQLSVPPDYGQSNRELIELLGELLAIRPFQVQLVSGHYRAIKMLRIVGVLRTEVEQRLHSGFISTDHA